MKITFKKLSLDDQRKFADLGGKVILAKQEFILCNPEETESKREALKAVWGEFVSGTVEKIEGGDVNDIQNIDFQEVLQSFFEKVLITKA